MDIWLQLSQIHWQLINLSNNFFSNAQKFLIKLVWILIIWAHSEWLLCPRKVWGRGRERDGGMEIFHYPLIVININLLRKFKAFRCSLKTFYMPKSKNYKFFQKFHKNIAIITLISAKILRRNISAIFYYFL